MMRSNGHQSNAEKTLARPKGGKEPVKAPKRKSLPAGEPPAKKRSKTSNKHDHSLLHTVDSDPQEPTRKAHDSPIEEEVIDRSSGKRRRHSFHHQNAPPKKVQKLEAELASAQETISSLKRSLQNKERALSHLAEDGAGVACVVPPLPPPNQQQLPGRDKYRSVPISSNKFGKTMEILAEDFGSFKKAAQAAEEARTELENMLETVKKLYHEGSRKVSVAEEKVTKKERDVVHDLREILEADVQIQDLREHRAGRAVRRILKKRKDRPAIRDLCDAIVKSWKGQIVEYMRENRQKKF